MLLEDEKHVVRWLNQYGALPRELVIRLLNMETRRAKQVIRNVITQGVVMNDPTWKYLLPHEYALPDGRIIYALWVLLKFINQVEPAGHIPARHPAQVLFLKGGLAYEILVLYEGEEHLIRLLRPEENTRYVLVLPDIAMAGKLVLPDAPCLFATVTDDDPVPKIRFYSEVPHET